MSAEELARRAVACKGWRWMPGMFAHSGAVRRVRVLCDENGDGSSDYVVRPGPNGNETQAMSEWGVMGSFPRPPTSSYPMLPDLDDPATLGCLLALVREAYSDPCMSTSANKSRGKTWWALYSRGDGPFGVHDGLPPTEAAALVAALEAAP